MEVFVGEPVLFGVVVELTTLVGTHLDAPTGLTLYFNFLGTRPVGVARNNNIGVPVIPPVSLSDTVGGVPTGISLHLMAQANFIADAP